MSRFLTRQAKNPFIFNILLGGASLVVVLAPAIVQASGLSFLDSLLGATAQVTSASSADFNSQTVPLLAAAVNLDPSPAVGGGDITVVDGSALAAVEGPSGTAADIETRPTNSQISIYIVRDGDTLSQIAQMFDVSVGTIIDANNIQHDVITPGETLVILPITGIQHTVVSGDTLASLAKKYNSNALDIAQYNDLSSDAQLAVGSTVIIPDGELSAPAAAVSTPASPSSSTKEPSLAKIAAGATEPYLGGSGPAIAGYFGWPLPASAGIVTQGLHGWNAVDIGAPTGTDILAAANGTVIVANGDGGWNGGYGNYVVIQHSNGTETLYAHMSRVLVHAGDTVAQGDTIGRVGMTGEATGPHVHFEVRGAENPFASLPLGSGDPL